MSAGGSGPPRVWRAILEWSARRLDTPELMGDAEEIFAQKVERRGVRRARAWYRRQARAALRRGVLTRSRPESHRPPRQAVVSWLDFKLAARMLAKHPMLTGVAVLALGLGIPASLTPTHVWHAYMAPLPFEDGERIVGVRWWDARAARPPDVTLPDFELWRHNLSAFEQIGAVRRAPWNVQFADGGAEPVRGAEMSASTFAVLRVPPELGRTLSAADEAPGAPNVAVIGAGLWTSRFGRSSGVLEQSLRVAGVPHAIVGVMPDGFSFPRDEVLWLPLREEGARGLQVVGRLAVGVSLEMAHAEVQAIGRLSGGIGPGADERVRAEVVTTAVLRAEVPAKGERDPLVYVTQLLALVLLLVACGNVGIMILARTSARAGEIAVRGALGASRRRIVGQLFVEGQLLALLATGIGLAVASWGAQRLETLAGPELNMMDFGIGWRTVGLALSLSVLCAGVASLVPALRATKGGIPGRPSQFADRGSTMRFGAGSSALIVAELALSVVLLSYGVAWTGTVLQDTSGDLGIQLDRYLSAQVLVSDPGYGIDLADYPAALRERLAEMQAELKRRVEAEPGVRTVAMASAGDLPGSRNAPRRVWVEATDFPIRSPTVAAWSRVDVDFFRALDQPILQGRDFLPTDLPPVLGRHRTPVIVNTTFVDQVLGGRNPVGRRIRYASDADDWYEIVGVVGALGLNPVNPDLDAGVYHPVAPGEVNAVGFVIDAGENPTGFIPRLREIAGEIDPAAMVRRPMLLSDLAALEWTGLRYLALAPVLFSLVSILLSAAGLYAIMSFTISRRTRELGVRAALGASRSDIVASIGRKAALQLVLGVSIGCVLAAPVMVGVADNPLIRPQNWLLVVLSVVIGLVAVCLAACLAPALRALRIEPTEALRDA